MFEHSVSVPRLYKEAAKILQKVQEYKESLKQCIYAAKHPNRKAIYALVLESSMRSQELSTILAQSDILQKNRLNPWLARILIVELLWGKKQLLSDCKPVQTILSYEKRLHELLLGATFTPKRKLKQKGNRPRYVRVNTLLITVEDCINAFRDEDWIFIRPRHSNNYQKFLKIATLLGPDEFTVDMHVKELLLFSPNAEFYNHSAYLNGFIVLQDKASCLAVNCLNPAPGSIVLDMCAAPGMKTTHMASLMQNQGILYSCEKDFHRFSVLNRTVEKYNATCVRTINKDVLNFYDSQCPNVEYILVDPSCSGSGMIDRFGTDEIISAERIKKLSNFQVMILRHALTNFNNAKRVVYSTCSIYSEENEFVVKEVLETIKDFQLISARDLINFESISDDSILKNCVYLKPDKDLTNGFFIAVFERIGGSNLNEMDNANSNTKVTSIINKVIGSPTEDSMHIKNSVCGADNEWEAEFLKTIDKKNTGKKKRKPSEVSVTPMKESITNKIDNPIVNETVPSERNSFVRDIKSTKIEITKCPKVVKPTNSKKQHTSKIDIKSGCEEIDTSYLKQSVTGKVKKKIKSIPSVNINKMKNESKVIDKEEFVKSVQIHEMKKVKNNMKSKQQTEKNRKKNKTA